MKRKLLVFPLFMWAVMCHAQSILDSAQWITVGYTEGTQRRACPVFQKSFNCVSKIRSAILNITALGLYEATINGQRVGDAYFTPGFTSYDHRLQYQQYDVTKLLRSVNSIQVTVGEGWYRGPFGGSLDKNNYGSHAGLLSELLIVYEDGKGEVIVSDTSWKCSPGPILYSELYDGELLDTWITPKNWVPVADLFYSKSILVPTENEPVRKQEIFYPVKVFPVTNDSSTIVDFGQNFAGWVQVKVKGNAGDTIKVEHAEVLDKAGNFYTDNLRDAKATDIYILNGTTQTLEPHFTFHGFRYCRISGGNLKVNAKNITGIALYSDMEKTGSFECSDSMLNKLQHNIVWSQNSNFVDIPTDCPQRSERLGWTGDAQVFIRTAAFNRNVKHFFSRWLKDLAADQSKNGGVSRTVPDVDAHAQGGTNDGIAGWSDAATIIPWKLFEVYNDTVTLRSQYPSMKSWVDYIRNHATNYLWAAAGFGDWNAPRESTELPYIDQCYFAYSAQLLINAAKVLGRDSDARIYGDLLQNVKQAFLNEYMTPKSRSVTKSQTAYVLALQFDMLPDSMRQGAADRLANLVREFDNHLSTGFLGTPYLLDVLTRFGYEDLAFTLLKQDTYPSWLYPIKMGATTMWERWDGIGQDGSVQATSYNHYAYGAVGDWLYRVVAGIDTDGPGYKKIIIHPHPGGGLTWVNASYKCSYGKIVSNWKVTGDKTYLDVQIPPKTTATIYLGEKILHVGPGAYHLIN